MNPLRIHLQLIGMAILWGASWPWGEWLLKLCRRLLRPVYDFLCDYSAHDLVICGKSL